MADQRLTSREQFVPSPHMVVSSPLRGLENAAIRQYTLFAFFIQRNLLKKHSNDKKLEQVFFGFRQLDLLFVIALYNNHIFIYTKTDTVKSAEQVAIARSSRALADCRA